MSSLQSFTFSAERSGEILKRWLIEARLSLSSAADHIGVTYDTLSNCLRGAVKQPSLLVVFKICALTGHTLDEYVSLMLAGSDVDTGYIFRTEAAPAPAAPAHGIDQAAVARYLERMDQHAAEEQRLIAARYDAEIAHMERDHDRTIAHMENEIAKLERRCTRLTCTLIAENIALAAVLVYDLFSHDIGWFRTSHMLRGMFTLTKS